MIRLCDFRFALVLPLALWSVASSGQTTYTVHEVPIQLLKHDAESNPYAYAMDERGTMLIDVSVYDETGYRHKSELCTDESCKRLRPKHGTNLWWAMSSNGGAFAGAEYQTPDPVLATRRLKGGDVEHLGQGVAAAINRHGVTVGDGIGNAPAFLYDAELHLLPGLGSGFSAARAINDVGKVVGFALTPRGQVHAVSWKNGVITDLGTLPLGSDSRAYAVSSGGTAAGCSNRDGDRHSHAVRFEHYGGITDLGTLGQPGLNDACAVGINRAGVVVGWSGNLPIDSQQAFVFDGAMTVLATRISEEDRARYWLRVARAINDAGQILVNAYRMPSGAPVVLRLDPAND